MERSASDLYSEQEIRVNNILKDVLMLKRKCGESNSQRIEKSIFDEIGNFRSVVKNTIAAKLNIPDENFTTNNRGTIIQKSAVTPSFMAKYYKNR